LTYYLTEETSSSFVALSSLFSFPFFPQDLCSVNALWDPYWPKPKLLAAFTFAFFFSSQLQLKAVEIFEEKIRRNLPSFHRES